MSEVDSLTVKGCSGGNGQVEIWELRPEGRLGSQVHLRFSLVTYTGPQVRVLSCIAFSLVTYTGPQE
jgi:hypothetical protein